jgi:hypothetical protein
MSNDGRSSSLAPGPHYEAARSRRDFLTRAGGGCGALALAALMQGAAAASLGAGARSPHFASRAKRVIWCFLDGGPSHVDLFDPKPLLNQLAGQPLPPSYPRPVTAMGRTANTPLLATRRTFRRHGQSGAWVSDWLPETAKCVDDIAFIKSCHADGLNHVGSVCQMNTGSVLGGRPSLGAWSSYGLGSESDDLPGYVVLLDYPEDPPGGSRNWGAGFMPATYQGTKFRDGATPILHLAPPPGVDDARQRGKLAFVQQLNRQGLGREGLGRQSPDLAADDELEARIAAYELAFRMQAAAPEAVDLASETAATHALYGLDQKETERTGRNCLLARRLVERGVRFVQIYCGSGSKWDAHSDVEGNHARYCRESDRPIAGLLTDLKQRGLLDETLVIWGGEFGRTPMSESGNGRDHNPYGFTTWLAGGGVRGGVTHGTTDDLGLYAVECRVHVHDLHATILHLVGLDHERLTFPHNGNEERLTLVAGRVVREIVA